jgi:hypothetical protein
MLPFYDSGSGTFYDLRHFTMKTSPKVKTTYRILIKLIPHRVKKEKDRWRDAVTGHQCVSVMGGFRDWPYFQWQ